ncbi:MAG: GIY-YIG nuclease family protein [Bacteroidota bacterium]
MKSYFVYIMTNKPRGVLYAGFTGSLDGRVLQHKQKEVPRSFTARYNCTNLVYFEEFWDPLSGIAREKEIKGWLRSKKVALIESMNPDWKDLSDDWFDGL